MSAKRPSISALFDADEIECLVRTAAEAVYGGGDCDSLSQRQADLAERAYDAILQEYNDWPPEPDFDAERALDAPTFYRTVFADHARACGIQETWTEFWAHHRAGGFRYVNENRLLRFLTMYMTGDTDYDASVTPPWTVTTRKVDDLSDGDLFSVDEGATWHLCGYVMFGTVSVYNGPGRDDDATFYHVEAKREQTCLVMAPTTGDGKTETAP